jgi:ectoine hydroxylase-related dioxygenase (phytanoyl-CoA dioxygenase family)
MAVDAVDASSGQQGAVQITSETIEQYWRDGVVHVPQLVARPWLDLIAEGIARIQRGTGRQNVFFAGDPGQFIDTVRNFELTPEFQRLLYDSPLADMAAQVLGSERVWLLFDHVFVKDGGADRSATHRTPWHQDLPYWPVDGTQLVSMWITLEEIPREECLEFVRGSHRGPVYDGFDPRRAGEDPTLPFYGEGFPRLPDIEADRSAWDIVAYDITPGDVVLLHPGVLHGGGQTSAGRRRRTLSVRFFGPDVVFASRPPTRPTAPFTPGLELVLQPGDPLRHPYYPRLRPLPPHQRPDYYD